MVQIRYLTKMGDTPRQVSLQEAQQIVGEAIDNGNIVFDENEKVLVERATMGHIRADSELAIFPALRGG